MRKKAERYKPQSSVDYKKEQKYENHYKLRSSAVVVVHLLPEEIEAQRRRKVFKGLRGKKGHLDTVCSWTGTPVLKLKKLNH